MGVASGQLADPLLRAEPLAVERERVGISVRERNLDRVCIGRRRRLGVVHQEADPVEEDREVVGHAELNVLGRTGASKDRKAYPAGRPDLVR